MPSAGCSSKAARKSSARSISTITAFTMPLLTTLPESRLTPSLIETTRGVGGPAGIIRIHAAGQRGWPSKKTSIGTRPVRKPGGNAAFTCVTPSCAGSPI